MPVAVARWLADREGLDAVARATTELDAGADALSLGASLRADGLDPPYASAVAEAAHARVRARARWARADALLLTRTGLEQASDPAVASWRAQRFPEDGEVVDLAAGIGGDTIALSRQARHVVAVDRDESRLVMLRHNATVHDLRPSVVVGDASAMPTRPADLLHVDPSRRTGNRRARRLADYRPSVAALEPLLAAARGGAVVLSPAVALDDPDLPQGEVEFIQLGPDLIEAVAWTGELSAEHPRSATILTTEGAFHLTARGERGRLASGDVGEWLIEVAAAAVRARLHDDIGAEIDARRVSSARALLTADEVPAPSPWYRAFPVEAELSARPRKVREYLRERADRPLEIVLHGVDADVDRWWRDLGRPPRGWGGRVVHLIRTAVGATCVVTGPPLGDRGPVEMVPGGPGER